MKLWRNEDDEERQKVEEFLSGSDVEDDERLLKYDLMGSAAHTKMLQEADLLDHAEAREIQEALKEIYEDGVDMEASDEDIHTKIENLVTERTAAGKKMHTGRSRNDQVVLDTRLLLKESIIDIALEILDVISRLLDKAESHKETVIPGYTHHQQAMPSTAGLWFASFAESLLDDLRAMEGAFEVIDSNPLGAAASYGTTLPIDRSLTAEYLDFSKLQVNTLYSVASRGKLEAMMLDDLDQVLLDINRLATDLVLFSTSEFDFVEMEDELVTGSSIMPQKENPDVAEILKGRTNRYIGSSTRIKMVLTNNMSGYNRDSQETKGILLEYLTQFQQILEAFELTVEGIEFSGLEGEVKEGTYSAYMANRKVEQGVPFRDAYHDVKEANFEAPDAQEFLSKQDVEGSPGNLSLETLRDSASDKQAKWSSRKESFEAVEEELLG